MVRRRNVRAEDSDDEREGDGGDRSRRRDRASAVAKRRQTPSPPPANDPNATLDGGCEATNGAGSAGVGLSKEDFDAIPQDTREAIVASIDKVRKLDDGFRELGAILDKCAQTHEQDHPEIPEDLFDIFKALEGYRLLTDVCAEGAKRGVHPRDVFASLPEAFVSEIGLNPIALLGKVTEGMPKLWRFLNEAYPEVVASCPTPAMAKSLAMNQGSETKDVRADAPASASAAPNESRRSTTVKQYVQDLMNGRKRDGEKELEHKVLQKMAETRNRDKTEELKRRIQNATNALGRLSFEKKNEIMDEIKKTNAEFASKLDSGEFDDEIFASLGDGSDGSGLGSDDDDDDDDDDDFPAPPSDTPYRYKVGDSVLVAWEPSSQDPPYDKGWRRAIVVDRHVPADTFEPQRAKLSARGHELAMLTAMYSLRDAGIDPVEVDESTRLPPAEYFIVPYVVKLMNDQGKEEKVPIPRDDPMHIRGCWEETKKCGKKPAKKLRFRANDQVEVWVGPGHALDGAHWIQGTVREYWSHYPGWGRGWDRNGRWLDGLRKDQVPYIVTPAGAEDEMAAHKAAHRLEQMYPPARTIQYGSMGVLNENTVLVLADTDEWIRIPKLRFRPGSRVECKIRDSSAANGGFHPGTVVGTFYREDHWRPGLCAPYQVRLDGERKLIYAPADNDSCIRAHPGH